MRSDAPAPASRWVMDAGISRIAQCHQPEGIGASGSKQVSMKLAVPSGKPCHVRSGERDPASAVADLGIGAPSVRVDEVRVKLGRSMPSKGAGAGASDLMLDGPAFHLRGDAGEASYFGAAPPAGDRPHRYVFTVHALDTDSLGLDDDATPAMASFAALEHTIARASLTVTHQA